MKAKKTIEDKDWTISGVKLTHEEFLEGIKKAEQGPLYTLEELKAKMKEWKLSQNM